MTTVEATPRIAGKLGRTAAKFPVMLSALHTFVTLPKAQATWAGPNDAAFDYGMLGNDRYGCCTFAGFVHLVQAICLLLGVTPPNPGDAAVVQAYLLFTHGQDTGANEADVLQALYATGILGIDLVGYAPGRGGLDELWSITEQFGAAYLGHMMPQPAQGQFQANEPWDLTGTSADNAIEGGHCTVGLAFDQNAEMAEVITWGKRQKVTFRWLDRYLDEKWAPIPKQVKDAGKLDGFNWAQLDAELHSLSGAVGG
jgi:hypothetical protein